MDALKTPQESELPFAKPLGLRLVEVAPYKVVAEMRARNDLCTRPAVLHGTMMALADTLGAYATVLNLPVGVGTTTIESKANLLASAPECSMARGEFMPVYRDQRTMVWHTRRTDQTGRLLGIVMQTQMVLERRPA